MTTTLLVVDDVQESFRQTVDNIPDGRVRILPLRITGDEIAAYLGDALDGVRVELMPIGEIARQSRDALAAAYPALIDAFVHEPIAGRSILDRLADGDVNLWWLGETSEKSALRCSLVNSLYSIELVSRAAAVCDADAILVAVRQPSLAASLSTLPRARPSTATKPVSRRHWRFVFRLLKRRLLFLARMLMTKVVLRGAPSSSDRTVRPRTMFLTSYPLNWSQPFAAAASDRIYGVLPQRIAEQEPVGYLALISARPRELWRRRHAILARLRESTILTVPGECSVSDLLAILNPRPIVKIVAAIAAVRRMPAWRYGGVDARPLLIEELECGLGSNELPYNQLVVKATRRVASRIGPRNVIHWGEWQPVEKALWYGLRGSPSRAVAVQHSMSGPMFLNYQFVRGELRRDSAVRSASVVAHQMPLPDLFVSNGEYAIESVIAGGYPSSRTRAVGAIRYRRLMELATARPDRDAIRATLGISSSERAIVFATASKRADNEHMLSSTTAALRELAGSFTVLVKCHPFLPMEREIGEALERGAPGTRILTFGVDTPLDKLLCAADLMIVNSSASGVEAITLDVPTIFFHNPHLYDVSILYSLPGAVEPACSATELTAAIRRLLTDSEALQDARERAREWLPYLFHRVDLHAEDRMIAFLGETDSLKSPLPS